MLIRVERDAERAGPAMVEKQRTESALTRRPLGERAAGRQRPLATAIAGRATDGEARELESRDEAASAELEPDFELDVSSSLETIHRVTQTYAVLLDKLSSYEREVRELSQSSRDAMEARDDALADLSDCRRLLQDERARSADATARAERSAAMVGTLERQLADLRRQTTKLMDAVDQLFPDLEEAAGGEMRGLRVVR